MTLPIIAPLIEFVKRFFNFFISSGDDSAEID
nr:MAG TPA: hypothetical protein [Caudoviricetes sp.]